MTIAFIFALVVGLFFGINAVLAFIARKHDIPTWLIPTGYYDNE